MEYFSNVKSLNTPHRTLYHLRLFSIHHGLSERHYRRRLMELFNEALRGIANEEGLQLVDVAAEVGGRRELFRDFWHFTTEGHEVVATLMARELAPDGQ